LESTYQLRALRCRTRKFGGSPWADLMTVEVWPSLISAGGLALIDKDPSNIRLGARAGRRDPWLPRLLASRTHFVLHSTVYLIPCKITPSAAISTLPLLVRGDTNVRQNPASILSFTHSLLIVGSATDTQTSGALASSSRFDLPTIPHHPLIPNGTTERQRPKGG
jgi:hypothetical protein